jgi:death-on-curing family protein
MKTLTTRELIEINKKLEEGGVVLNQGNLEAVIEKASHAKTPENYASRILYETISLHPFLDGNKRTAITAFDTVLKANAVHNTIPDEELERIALEVALGKSSIPKIEKRLGKVLCPA